MAKFQTLEHKGPLFPKEFDEMVSFEVKGTIYKGLPLEMLYAYAKYTETDYVKEKTFRTNFLNDFTVECEKVGLPVYAFPNDYEPAFAAMKKVQEDLKEIKKSLSKEEKLADKAVKDQIKTDYGFAIINGNKQQIGNYMIEPPGIFMARGASPVKGCWKYRVQPEDVIINCSANAPVPPKGHSWKKIECNTNNLYTFAFDIKIGQKVITPKHIRFSYSSDIGQAQDQKKFMKAETLCHKFNDMNEYIRKNYTYTKTIALHKDDPLTIECAVIAWLIQNTSIRIGNDPDENAADIVGASTLKVENVKLTANNTDYTLHLDFIGKDSIQNSRSFIFNDTNVYKRLESFIKNKNKKDKIFKATASDVNNFLQKFLPEITAKLFRPTMGTATLVEQLKVLNVKKEDPLSVKVLAFTKANIKTAELLNHKKAVSKNFSASFDKSKDGLKEAKIKFGELKKNAAADLTKVRNDLEAAKKVFTGDKLASAKERAKVKKEKIELRIKKAEERIFALENKLEIKGATKETSIGTSRGSYIDPKVVASWCKAVDLPMEKLYTSSIMKRFAWCQNVNEKHWTTYHY